MRRAPIVVAVVVLAIPLAAVAAASWFLNGDAVKARLVEQVRRATGRELTIAGPVSLAWALSPTVALNDVSLGNPPGFSQPEMAHAARLEARIALTPLLQRRVEIERIAVTAPSARLERNAAGRANWEFGPPPAAPAAPSVPSQPGGGNGFTLAVGAVDITNASITWGAQTVTAQHLAYDPRTGHVDGALAASGTALALSGTVGPVAGGAYPLDLRLGGSGVAAALTGTSAAATLAITAPDLAALSPLVGRALPPVRDVSISAALPGPGALRIQAGAANFGALTVQNAVLTAASPADPADFSANAVSGALPLAISGHLGSVAALLRGPTPVDARFEAPGLSASAAGTLTAAGAGELQLTLQSPDLAAAGVQAGIALPNLRMLNVATGLSFAPGRTVLTALHLTSAQGDLSGDLTLTNAGRPALRGTLSSTGFDLDAARAAPTPVTAATPPQAAPGSTPAPVAPSRLIPETKLPLAALRAADADLQLQAASLHFGGADYHGVQAHAALQDGTLRLDPVTAAVGAATARFTVELAAQPPALHVTLDAPGLPFGPLAALAGGSAAAAGTVDLRADLAGVGDNLRAVAATLTGHAGLAVVDAQVDNALLERLAAGAIRSINLPLEAGGGTTVRCAAFRADAAAGLVQLPALTLDTSKLALDGSGSLNLADESLDLHLRPQLRLGGGLSVPLRVRGTLASPKVALDPGAISPGRVGIVLGGAPPPDACGPALALARDGNAGPPAAAAPPARSIKPADILRGLLR